MELTQPVAPPKAHRGRILENETMTTIKVDAYDLSRMVFLLDASIEALDAAAALEKRREAGKTMRQITQQERAKTVRGFVPEMAKKYGIELDLD